MLLAYNNPAFPILEEDGGGGGQYKTLCRSCGLQYYLLEIKPSIVRQFL
jgi:hypothetical protein